jgi:multidrug efflux system membrane fusion protein
MDHQATTPPVMRSPRYPEGQRWRGPGLLSVSVVALLALAACSKPEPPPEPIRAVRTMVVGSGQSQLAQELAGEVRARTESRLSFRVGGKLAERPVQLGDVVRKGQVLARLDPQDLKLIEQGALAAVQAAQVQADQAQADLKRFQGLRDQGFVSEAELERRASTAAAARAQLAQAQAQAGVQGRQTTYGQLVADASGVITAVEAEPGAVVSAGAPIVRLAWDGARDIVFSVPEDRVAALRALMGRQGALSVRLWADESRPWKATLREVSAAADPSTRTFQVKADLLTPAGVASPKLGQTGTVVLPGPALAGVVKLPLAALLQQQGRTVVWVLEPGTMQVKLQPVTLAGADGNEVVISGGLQPGQEVVTAGVHVLTAGQIVKRYGVATAAASTPAAAAPGAPASAASR